MNMGGHFIEFVERNLLKFLAKQMHSLESIRMFECTPKLAEHLFNNMPALKYLKIRDELRTKNLRLNLKS